MNQTLIVKHSWHVCTTPNKIWVQVIKSRYMRGRKTLDIQSTAIPDSWAWSSIQFCSKVLKLGICYQLGRNLKDSILVDPWVLQLPNFIIPLATPLPNNLSNVRQLIQPGEGRWGQGKLSRLFPSSVIDHILHILIIDREHDKLIWTPSTSRLW